MLGISVWSERRAGLWAYLGIVAKPVVIISVGYCALSNFSFESAADGSLSMNRAAEVGLVSVNYAKQHAEDAVLFKRVGPTLFEYRVKHPLVGYAGIPWLVSRRTSIDLANHCESIGTEGCKLEQNQ